MFVHAFCSLALRRMQRSLTVYISTANHLQYLNQVNAQKLDQDLMSTPGFSVDQLMELAGWNGQEDEMSRFELCDQYCEGI